MIQELETLLHQCGVSPHPASKVPTEIKTYLRYEGKVYIHKGCPLCNGDLLCIARLVPTRKDPHVLEIIGLELPQCLKEPNFIEAPHLWDEWDDLHNTLHNELLWRKRMNKLVSMLNEKHTFYMPKKQ